MLISDPMSRYSDKRAKASCASPADCPRIGTMLRLVNQKPYWFCVHHADEIDRQKNG